MSIIKDFSQYKREFKIFLDMDGVITDFVQAFIDIPKNKEDLDWDRFVNKYSITQAWKIIGERGIEWWEDMPWTKDGKELWEYLKKYDPTILSKPSRDKLSSLGKFEWCKRELGLNQESYTTSSKESKWDEDSRIILTTNKEDFADRYYNSILIDDTKKNIENWRESGGVGILHKSTEKTIKQLEEILSNI